MLSALYIIAFLSVPRVLHHWYTHIHTYTNIHRGETDYSVHSIHSIVTRVAKCTRI